jgi:hypothetical protein
MSNCSRVPILDDPEEKRLIDILKTLPPGKRRRTYHKIVKSLESVPATIEELWSNTGARQLTNRAFVNVRVDLLQFAGWDPGGWTIMEWPRLPLELQNALRQEFPSFQQIIREESLKLVERLKTEYKEAFLGE